LSVQAYTETSDSGCGGRSLAFRQRPTLRDGNRVRTTEMGIVRYYKGDMELEDAREIVDGFDACMRHGGGDNSTPAGSRKSRRQLPHHL
jgi:hypothetical protein